MARPFSVALGAAEFLITSTPTAIIPTATGALQTSLLLPRDETRIAFRSVIILSGTSSGDRKFD